MIARLPTLALLLLSACTVETAQQRTYYCESQAECRDGWACVANQCRPGARPDQALAEMGRPDMTLDLGPPDRGPLDQGPPDMAWLDMRSPDVGQPDMAVPDMAVPDMAPPDMAVPDMAAPDMAAPDMAAPDMAAPDLGPPDADGDGIADAVDNCPEMANPEQADRDADGLGDVCDGDLDGDGFANAIDRCPLIPTPGDNQEAYCLPCVAEGARVQVGIGPPRCGEPGCSGTLLQSVRIGRCRNGLPAEFSNPFDQEIPCDARQQCVQTPDRAVCEVVDACLAALDSDGDGIDDLADNCPETANPLQYDTDRDGSGDACVECAVDADCRLRVTRCERQCGAVVESFRDGRCEAGACAFADPPNDRRVDCGANACVRGVCEAAPAECSDDDADGVADLLDNCVGWFNPDQVDSDRDGVGDACDTACGANADCPIEARPIRCAAAPGSVCGGDVIAAGFSGACLADRCEVDELRRACTPTQICTVGPLGPECVEDLSCTLPEACAGELDGQPCRIDLDTGREVGRCVDAICRSWTCVLPDCNESGARHFTDGPLNLVVDQAARTVVDQRTALHWRAMAGFIEPLDAAHARCAALDDGLPWRLPSVWELQTILPGTQTERDRFLAVFQAVPEALLSRTVVDAVLANQVLRVTLAAGPVGQLEPRGLDEAGEYFCVRETAPRRRDVAARRVAAQAEAFVDPWTGLGWSAIDARLVEQAAAGQACEAQNARLPTVRELTTLFVWKQGASPGWWPAADIDGFGALVVPLWTRDVVDQGALVFMRADGRLEVAEAADRAGRICVSDAP